MTTISPTSVDPLPSSTEVDGDTVTVFMSDGSEITLPIASVQNIITGWEGVVRLWQAFHETDQRKRYTVVAEALGYQGWTDFSVGSGCTDFLSSDTSRILSVPNRVFPGWEAKMEFAEQRAGISEDQRRSRGGLMAEIRAGFRFNGYCQGEFGRDSYGTRTVVAVDQQEDRWVLCRSSNFGGEYYFELFQVGAGESATRALGEIVDEQIETDRQNAGDPS